MNASTRWSLWGAACLCLFLTAISQQHQQKQQAWLKMDPLGPDSGANSPETVATVTLAETTRLFQHRRLSATSTNNTEDQPSSPPKPARFLMGIFTIAKERERRDLIRQALAMYQDSRICFVGSVDANLPQAPASHCELIYTFVFGANLDGPTQVLRDNSSLPVLTTPPAGFNTTLEPNDITFLNIKENMEDGKTPTWFHYASLLMNAFDLDYTIKCDSDTFVRVDRFFRISQEYLPRKAQSRYAGKMTWSFLRNHTYMEGQFYVLSKDLAELVSSMSVQYISGVVNIEDSDTGYFIMNQKNRVVHMIVLRDRYGRLPWKHPLKKIKHFKDELTKESRRLFGNTSQY